MAPVTVVSDTTHYLPAELAEREGIRSVSLYVNWGEGAQRESELDGFDAFYERLRSTRDWPTTSQPSIGDFLAVYEPLIEQGRDIVSVHLSGGISGTIGAARQAKELLEERGVRDRIAIVDSETTAGGLGSVLLATAAAAAGGADIERTVARAHAARSALEIWFSVDTLEYLQRGGRIGKAQAWIGGALKVKPILSLGVEVEPVERVRTAGRAFERMVQYLESRKASGADAWIVQHVQAADVAERIVERGRELFGSEPLFVSEIGPVLGSYTGPGMIGVGGMPRSLLDP